MQKIPKIEPLVSFDFDSDLIPTTEMEIPEGNESEQDLEQVSPAVLRKTVVFATDWTAETILSQLAKGTIKLDPSFQRRNAWQEDRKSKFIESLILGLPIPQIVLAENPAEKGKFVVIDGKQRLLCLQQFAGLDGIAPLRLSHLEHLPELNDKTYEDLRTDLSLQSDLSAFENQPIRAVVLKNWQDESLLYLIFYRLNSGSVPLSPQELRQALHPGPFMQFALAYSETSVGIHRVLNLKRADFRMRDTELLIRTLSLRFFIAQYDGNLKHFLDRSCKLFNREWSARRAEIGTELEQVEATITFLFEMFDGKPFRKWDGERFEGRFNRAIFDIMMYFFTAPEVRTALKDQMQEVVRAFQDLCEFDGDFRRSVETTTKSIAATNYRFVSWAKALNALAGRKIVSFPR